MATKSEWKGKRKPAKQAAVPGDEESLASDPQSAEDLAAQENLPEETGAGELPPRPLDPPGVDVPAHPNPAKPAPPPVPPPVPHCRATSGELEHSATIEELEAVCEGAPDRFIIEQLRARATMQEAARTWQAMNEDATRRYGDHPVIWIALPFAHEPLNPSKGFQTRVRLHQEYQLNARLALVNNKLRNGMDNVRAKLGNGAYVVKQSDVPKKFLELADEAIAEADARLAQQAAELAAQSEPEPTKTDPAD